MGTKTYEQAKVIGVGVGHRIGNIRFSYQSNSYYYGRRQGKRSILNGEEIRGHVQAASTTSADVEQLLGWLKENATHHDIIINGWSRTRLKSDADLDLFISNAPVSYSLNGDFRRKLTDKEKGILQAHDQRVLEQAKEQKRKAAEARKRKAEQARRAELRAASDVEDEKLQDLAMALKILKRNGLKVVVAADSERRMK